MSYFFRPSLDLANGGMSIPGLAEIRNSFGAELSASPVICKLPFPTSKLDMLDKWLH